MPDEQPKPKGIDWTNINIGLKEFLAAMVFVISMSGVYYNLYYKQDSIRVDLQGKIDKLSEENKSLKASLTTLGTDVQNLKDDKTARDAVNNAAINQSNFVPMRRVK